MMRHIKLRGKTGAVITTMPPVVLDGIIEIAMIFARKRLPFVITEKDGGKHMDGSLHYTGSLLTSPVGRSRSQEARTSAQLGQRTAWTGM